MPTIVGATLVVARRPHKKLLVAIVPVTEAKRQEDEAA
jgi:hypothetical protein